MDWTPLRALVLDANRGAYGVAVTVTIQSDAPIAAVGIWVTPASVDFPATGELRRREPQRILALGKDEVPRLVRGTLVDAPEVSGGTVRRWRYDGLAEDLPDQWRIYVVPDPVP